MPATWPSGVPYKLLRAGASAPEGELVGRSPTDSGLARQRKMFTAAPNGFSGQIPMTWAQYLTFRAWRQGLGGATFNWLGSPGGETLECRFIAGAQGAPTPHQAAAKWLVPVAFEVIL